MLSLGLKKAGNLGFCHLLKKINANVFGAFFHEWDLQPSCVCVIFVPELLSVTSLVLPSVMRVNSEWKL